MDTYGISVQLLADATGAHIDTARRWKRTGKMPTTAQLLLQIRGLGDLGSIDTAWNGFGLVKGKLWTPEGRGVTPGDVRALPYLIDLAREQRRQLLRERSEPRQWELSLSG